MWAAALIGAVVYLIIRPLLIGPTWLRLATAAVGGGTTLGALLVAPDTFDFRALDPPLLPVVLFVAIPILHLLVFLPLAEWWLADESWFMRSPARPVRYTLLVWLLGGARPAAPAAGHRGLRKLCSRWCVSAGRRREPWPS